MSIWYTVHVETIRDAQKHELVPAFGDQVETLALRTRRFIESPRHASWMYQNFDFDEFQMHQLLHYSLQSRMKGLHQMGYPEYAVERMSDGYLLAETEVL